MQIRFSKTSKNYGCFSNFAKYTVDYNGIKYQNSEAAWQAQKTLDNEQRMQFQLLSASEAKRLGRRVNLRPDWEEVKYKLMVEVCYAKFTQNPEIGKVLVDTGDAEIIENTTGWHDNIWGDCQCEKCINKIGRNLLGKALMEVRQRLIEDGE